MSNVTEGISDIQDGHIFTSAIINDKNIDISKIASEAQLTDLQLTLMLAMSNRYQWTPWKALLLDDPTQHHDLVHASSVFDVLRDYIIEFDYQILMSTHDSIQVNFFKIKLAGYQEMLMDDMMEEVRGMKIEETSLSRERWNHLLMSSPIGRVDTGKN